jgi:hypothetical protein
MIGVTANVTVRLKIETNSPDGGAGGTWVQKGEESIELHDEMQASGFDECC